MKAHAQPHIADIDSDGDLELGITSFNDYDGWVHVIPIVPSTYDAADRVAWWPKFRRDAAATGVVPLKSVSGVVGEPAARSAEIASVSPNPFNPRTTIVCACAEAGRVELTVHDLAGRRIASLVDGWLDAGRHGFAWNGRDVAGRPVAAGPYLVRLRTGAGADVRKVILAK